MRYLKNLPRLFDQEQFLVALETPRTERLKVLSFLLPLASSRGLPLYFWNPGYQKLRRVQSEAETLQLIPTDVECLEGLAWLLDNSQVPGMFVFEGALTPDNAATGTFSHSQLAMISNLAYDLAARGQQQLMVALETYIEIPQELVPLVPVLVNPLPEAGEVRQLMESRFECHDDSLAALIRTCLGLPMGELEMTLQRVLGFADTVERVTNGVLTYKKSKLKGQGVEFISEPDVSEAGGMDLLEGMLERAAALLKPEAREYNLKFPKGMILWGPPGTGKSLSAKLAAQKMGVPMVAADWAGLRGATAYESRKNLREFLQFCDANGEYGLVLYFDDFDKGFAGFDSDSDGGCLVSWRVNCSPGCRREPLRSW